MPVSELWVSEQIDYLLIPKTHIWRDNPMWTIKISDNGVSFLLFMLYKRQIVINKLRYRSQTWVTRNDSEEDQQTHQLRDGVI